MHPKNIYKHPPNFKELAEVYPNFRKFVKLELSGKVKFDFQNPEALCELTKILLLKDFNLNVEIPADKLIPTLPLRLNYILWIEDLLVVLQDKKGNVAAEETEVTGIDIGTGASCIYSLLAATKGWKMLATEVDTTSVDVARQNVERNSLGGLITVKKVSPKNLVLKGVVDDGQYHFCMCNPPFFAPKETPGMRTCKRPPPKNAPTGSPGELETEGGEVSFVSKIIEDSALLKDKIAIFTSMVGKRSTLKALKPRIEACGVKSMITTEFQQGRTTRWGLAWSYLVDLPKLEESYIKVVKQKKTLPVVYELPEGNTLEGSVDRIKSLLTELQMVLRERHRKPFTCLVTAFEDTWGNQRRKRRKILRQNSDGSPPEKKRKIETTVTSTSEHGTPLLEFNVKVYACKNVVTVEVSWLAGSAGKDGVHQVMQYLKNNWLPVKVKESL